MPSNLYSTISEESARFGERNDCGVLAVALATDTSYETAHACLAHLGRADRKGTPWNAIWNGLTELGFKAINITRSRKKWGSVSKVAGKLRPTRTYLVHTSKHILCVKGGVVHDWSAERKMRIKTVWQILPR
jgi:hypothetical protein